MGVWQREIITTRRPAEWLYIAGRLTRQSSFINIHVHVHVHIYMYLYIIHIYMYIYMYMVYTSYMYTVYIYTCIYTWFIHHTCILYTSTCTSAWFIHVVPPHTKWLFRPSAVPQSPCIHQLSITLDQWSASYAGENTHTMYTCVHTHKVVYWYMYSLSNKGKINVSHNIGQNCL